jgi:hypothetical protein
MNITSRSSSIKASGSWKEWCRSVYKNDCWFHGAEREISNGFVSFRAGNGVIVLGGYSEVLAILGVVLAREDVLLGFICLA